MDSVHTSDNIKSENQKSVKVLDELLNALTISKTADQTSAAAGSIATFINGDIEENDAPTKSVCPFPSSCCDCEPAFATVALQARHSLEIC